MNIKKVSHKANTDQVNASMQGKNTERSGGGNEPKVSDHTPTPWTSHLTTIYREGRIGFEVIASVPNQADAELIVTAVNLRHELLNALKKDHDTLSVYRKCNPVDSLCSVCQLIAKAEEK